MGGRSGGSSGGSSGARGGRWLLHRLIAFFIAGRSGAGDLARFPTALLAPTSAAVAGAAARAADCFFAGGLVIVPLGDCTICGARPCERGQTTAFVRKKVVRKRGFFRIRARRGSLEATPARAGQPRRTWSPGFAVLALCPQCGSSAWGGSHTSLQREHLFVRRLTYGNDTQRSKCVFWRLFRSSKPNTQPFSQPQNPKPSPLRGLKTQNPVRCADPKPKTRVGG